MLNLYINYKYGQTNYPKRSKKHAKKIVEIIKAVHPDNLDNLDNGFLLSNQGEKRYAEIIEKTNYCYIAEIDKSSVGFLLAYFIPDIGYLDYLHEYLTDKFSDEKFLYIYQVAILPAFQKRGIGQQLYNRFHNDTKNIKIRVSTSAIPYNKASEMFHLKLGYKKFDKVERNNRAGFLYEK